MSTTSPEQPKKDTLPPFPTDETVVVPPPEHRDDKNQGLSLRAKIGAAAAVVVTGIGGVIGYNALSGGSDGDPQDKRAEQSTSKVVDGGLVAFDEEENWDRNGDHSPDNGTDVNDNGVTDSDELWDSEAKEFVDPEAGSDEAALENATPKDLQMMSAIELAYPDIGESEVHWKADFMQLEPRVKRYMVIVAESPGSFEDETQWKSEILSALSMTAAELEEADND